MFGWLKRASLALCAGAILSLPATAAAVMNNGVTVPVLDTNQTGCVDKNVEVCIDGAEGDPSLIDTQVDALVAPETFQPTCQLTFKPIVKGGSIYDVFGWYNVKPDPNNPGEFLKPTQSELYGMFVTNDFKTGAQLAGQEVVLDLGVEAAEGRYKGGQIGFFLVSTSDVLSIDPTTHKIIGTIRFQFHTQHALNSMNATTLYNVLTWESVAHENTFYFGWEDLPVDGGSDNDFDDFVFSVTGVQCGGGGQPCDTGKLGVCAGGILQCKKSVITCVQTIPEGAETCNALDDDCNGEVDEGDGLCPEGEFCNRGVCVGKCGTGEFRCPETLKCTPEGLCVDEACLEVTCDAGKVCQAGECVDSCSGIVCPYDRVCRNGGCVDPCLGIECDEGFQCVLGVCANCACSACADGQMCNAAKQCVDEGCDGTTCNENTHCVAGACVDDCEGVVCPNGQLCSAGECVADPNGPSDPSVDPVDPPIIIGGSSNGGGGGSNNGGRTNEKLVPADPACGCKAVGSSTSNGSAALLLLALVGLARRRRVA